jgi:hypothetical protein
LIVWSYDLSRELLCLLSCFGASLDWLLCLFVCLINWLIDWYFDYIWMIGLVIGLVTSSNQYTDGMTWRDTTRHLISPFEVSNHNNQRTIIWNKVKHMIWQLIEVPTFLTDWVTVWLIRAWSGNGLANWLAIPLSDPPLCDEWNVKNSCCVFVEQVSWCPWCLDGKLILVASEAYRVVWALRLLRLFRIVRLGKMSRTGQWEPELFPTQECWTPLLRGMPNLRYYENWVNHFCTSSLTVCLVEFGSAEWVRTAKAKDSQGWWSSWLWFPGCVPKSSHVIKVQISKHGRQVLKQLALHWVSLSGVSHNLAWTFRSAIWQESNLESFSKIREYSFIEFIRISICLIWCSKVLLQEGAYQPYAYGIRLGPGPQKRISGLKRPNHFHFIWPDTYSWIFFEGTSAHLFDQFMSG